MIKLERIDWCPGCGWRRLSGLGSKPEGPDEWKQVGEALHEDERAHPCCNPACREQWGTGCWHCHSPRFAPKPTRLRKIMSWRNRAAREANRSAPRGTHYDLDALALKADRAERDREMMPSLPRWQRGEWKHINQRARGER